MKNDYRYYVGKPFRIYHQGRATRYVLGKGMLLWCRGLESGTPSCVIERPMWPKAGTVRVSVSDLSKQPVPFEEWTTYAEVEKTW